MNNFGPRLTEGELLLVPVESVPEIWFRAWHMIKGRRRNGNPSRGAPEGYDIERLHQRLLLGQDRLWMAAFTKAKKKLMTRFGGVVITTVGPPPPSRAKNLFSKEKSLVVHIIAGDLLFAWMDDAVEKITAYGHDMGCKQCFVASRYEWQNYAKKFYGRFEHVGYTRDRVWTKHWMFKGVTNLKQRPGYYRHVEPWPEGVKFHTARKRRRFAYLPKGATHGSNG